MAPPSRVGPTPTLSLLSIVVLTAALCCRIGPAYATWCVARSDASDQSLQTALDYACSSGADCTPLQSNGLCFLPNTVLAHASYAFNSYYQRRNMAPGSCDFSGTATIAKTDPSYGSCVFPPTPSAAGGISTSPGTGGGGSSTVTPTVGGAPPPPLMNAPFYGGGGGGLTPGTDPDTQGSEASRIFRKARAALVVPIAVHVLSSFLVRSV